MDCRHSSLGKHDVSKMCVTKTINRELMPVLKIMHHKSINLLERNII